VRIDEQVALAWQSLLHAAARSFDLRLWSPWLLLAVLEGILLAGLCLMAHPAFSTLMAPLVSRLGGADALHYPGLFAALPVIYARLDLLLIALPGAVVLGASTALFAESFRGRGPKPGSAIATALRGVITLILVNLPYHLLAGAAGFAISAVTGSRGGIVAAAGYVFALVISVVVQSVFLYVNALVMIEGHGIRGTFAALPRTWANGFFSALVLGVLLLLPLLPLNLLSGTAGTIAVRGTPELVALILAAQIAVALYAGFLLQGASTLVYLTTMSTADGQRSR
jgi:hypothetical protein